jgi:hypothetical protein
MLRGLLTSTLGNQTIASNAVINTAGGEDMEHKQRIIDIETSRSTQD